MRYLTVLFDSDCGLCSRIGTRLLEPPKWIPLRILPSTCTTQLHPALATRREELMAVSDEGGVYLGDHVWLMCLYALKRYRRAAERRSRPALAPFAWQAFKLLSANRHRVSTWLGMFTDAELHAELGRIQPPCCHGTNA